VDAVPQPAIAVYFQSPFDLESVAERLEVVGVFYDLHACSVRSDGDSDLFDGAVFRVEASGQGASITRNEMMNYYKVYVPVELDALRKRASFIPTMNFSAALEEARRNGYCITVAGGQVLRGFHSNSIEVPLVVAGESLAVRE
jgi:hypothetical protein